MVIDHTCTCGANLYLKGFPGIIGPRAEQWLTFHMGCIPGVKSGLVTVSRTKPEPPGDLMSAEEHNHPGYP